MSGAASTSPGTPIPEFKQTMGHPAPLWMLFMTEFWERFAFYGIRWALVLYIVAQFFGGDPSGEKSANQTYGAYLALVYAGAIFGGYVADKVLGYQRSILLGAVIMAAGLFMIAVPDARLFDPDTAFKPFDRRFNWKALSRSAPLDDPDDMRRPFEDPDDALAKVVTARRR